LWEGDSMLQLRLSQGISSGCHHATPTPFFNIVISVGKGHYASASTYPGFFSGWHHATLHTKKILFFGNCQCGEGAIFFCFDLDREFLQGAPCQPQTKKFLICIIVGRGIMHRLRLSQGISSWCHHDKHKPNFFFIAGRVIYASTSTKTKYFFRVPPKHSYTPKIW